MLMLGEMKTVGASVTAARKRWWQIGADKVRSVSRGRQKSAILLDRGFPVGSAIDFIDEFGLTLRPLAHLKFSIWVHFMA
jgi:hypothetical protein